jgi:hypothetical protein
MIREIGVQHRDVNSGLQPQFMICEARQMNIPTDTSRQTILKEIGRARRRVWTDHDRRSQQHRGIGRHARRITALYPHANELIQLSPQSIEGLMNRPETLPRSLDDLLTTIPMNWKEQVVGMSAGPH